MDKTGVKYFLLSLLCMVPVSSVFLFSAFPSTYIVGKKRTQDKNLPLCATIQVICKRHNKTIAIHQNICLFFIYKIPVLWYGIFQDIY